MPDLDVDTRTCACGAEMFFAMTAQDKRMPVSAGSVWDPAGNLAVWRDGGGKVRCRVLGKDEPTDTHEVRYRSHFTDCPDAASHRRR